MKYGCGWYYWISVELHWSSASFSIESQRSFFHEDLVEVSPRLLQPTGPVKDARYFLRSSPMSMGAKEFLH